MTLEAEPAAENEVASWVPFIGSYGVTCTQSNPSGGRCAGHHSYPAIDFDLPVGAAVRASGAGIVHETGGGDSRGNFVAIRHADGVYSRYLHLSRIDVRAGQAVSLGSVIGLAGNTGRSTGPHLHYDEQRPYGTPKSVGTMSGVVGGRQVQYPDQVGHAAWADVPWGTRIRNDSFTPVVTPRQWGGPAIATGDLDGDSFDEVVVGAPGEDLGTTLDAGAVTVVGGAAGGVDPADSRQLVSGTGIAGSAEAGDVAGAALAVGDFDDDGFDDLVVGVPREDVPGAADAGLIAIVRGSASGPAGSRQAWSGPDGGLAGNAERGDQFGASLAAADLNDDGFDDLVVGVPGEDGTAPDVGAVVLVMGSPTGLTNQGSRQLVSGSGGLAGTAEGGDLVGAAVAAGDVTGDGLADVAMGAPGEDTGSAANAGAVIVAPGAPGGVTLASSRQRWAGGGLTGQAEANDLLGAALAAGNVAGDPAEDLAVGVPGEDGAASNTGAVVVATGGPTGVLNAGSTAHVSGGPGVAGQAESGDRFGSSLAVGDVDGVGVAEVVAGAPTENAGGATDGGAVVVFGGTAPSVELHSGTSGVAGAPESFDMLGVTVAVGDVDADLDGDLLLGAPMEDTGGGRDAGAFTLVPGGPTGLPAAGSRQLYSGGAGLAGVSEAGDRLGGLLPPFVA